MPISISSGVQVQPPFIILYGDRGNGKTSWAAHAPAPIFIRTEDGMGILDAPRFDDVATKYQMILDQITYLIKEDHQHKTLVIDSLDHLEPLVWAEVVATEQKKKPAIKKIEDIEFQKGYLYAVDYWRQILDGLLYLRTVKKMTIILIAHCNAKEFHDPNSDSYGRWQIKLHKHASDLLQEKADAVLFLTTEVFTEKDKDTERVRGVGSGKRIIYTEKRPAYVAKNRYALPQELPFPDARSGWSTFASAIATSVTAAMSSSTPSATAATK
jgi:hypothetical protein